MKKKIMKVKKAKKAKKVKVETNIESEIKEPEIYAKIIFSISGETYISEGKGKNKLEAIINALKNLKPDKYTDFKGVLVAECEGQTSTVQINIRQIKQLFVFGRITNEVQRIILAKKLLMYLR